MTKVRQCCTFLWMQEANAPRRVVFTRPYHCAACVGEMVRSAKLQRVTVAGSLSMDRVREVLVKERAQLLDRWVRQLRAAADAGFALDPVTAQVLPELLEATDRALDRRFRAPSADAPPIEAEARHAAIRCSLLGDYLFDSVLEQLPELNVAEQRLLSDATAHASVEVQVRWALLREQENRRKEAARLGRLAHELRNAVTAAGLSLELLRQRGELGDSRAARSLEQSLARLRDGVEDTLLDEVLTAGGLRFARVKLGPVLADAHSAASALGAGEKKVRVLLEKPSPLLLVQADPRLVRPALRGLLRAALEVARRGTTVRCSASPSRGRARVAVSVDKLAGNRLPGLQALNLVRRAAKAQGGSLLTRVTAGDGCEFRLDLPRAPL